MSHLKYILLFCFFYLNITHSNGQDTKFISIYLYSFTKYISWKNPTYKDGDFVIGVFGNSELFQKLNETVANKTVGNQKIIVKKFNVLEEIEKSHILFVASWKSEEFSKVMKLINTDNTLVVTEKDGLIKKGSIINFVKKEKEGEEVIQFEIHKGNATARNIQISDRLIGMAFKAY